MGSFFNALIETLGYGDGGFRPTGISGRKEQMNKKYPLHWQT